MKKYLNLVIVFISLATILSGVVQLIFPGLVLDFVGAQSDPTSLHFFSIVGMFMTLFGGLMLHTVYLAEHNSVAVMWCALQKLGAFAAVGLGIVNGIFAEVAWVVAIFDLFSGGLFLYYNYMQRSYATI